MPVDGPDHVSREDSAAFDERKILAITLSANLVYDRRTGRERVVQIGPYYLQWAPHERGLQVELVSDCFLAEADRLTPFGETRMRALGFYAPSDDSPNWTLHLEDEWRALELAETVVTALLEVYRVPLHDLAAAVGPLPPFDDMTEHSPHLDPGTSLAHPLTIRKRVPATKQGQSNSTTATPGSTRDTGRGPPWTCSSARNDSSGSHPAPTESTRSHATRSRPERSATPPSCCARTCPSMDW